MKATFSESKRQAEMMIPTSSPQKVVARHELAKIAASIIMESL
jgi:hypothetical protein